MGSKRPMQNLILEILNAQPSLRDSKTYLNYFGPRVAGSGSKQQQQKQSQPPPFYLQPKANAASHQQNQHQQHIAHAGPPPPPLRPFAPKSKQQQEQDRFKQELLNSSPQKQQQQQQQLQAATDDDLQADSHQFAQPDVALRPTATMERTSNSSAQEATLAESLSMPPVHQQQHTALVKIQGPFTDRQLESIAEGMVYLKRLGLVSVIVMDAEDMAWRGVTSHFDPETGARVDLEAQEAEQERKGLAPWLSQSNDAAAAKAHLQSAQQPSYTQASSSSSSRLETQKASKAKGEEALRKRMLSEVHRLAELLIEKGAPARPYSHPILRIDAGSVKSFMQSHPPDLPGKIKAHPRYSWAERMSSMRQGRSSMTGQSMQSGEDDDAAPVSRTPLVSDDGLSSMRSALAHDMIPVIAPLALFEDPEVGGAPRTTCVSADDVVVALTREMAAKAKQEEESSSGAGVGDVDLMPLRLMVINREGGIPSHARGGNPHLSINLASEYSHLTNSFIWNRTHPTALSNLAMVRDCLAYMPPTSSGVVVSHRSPRSLIANLITNKAAHSPSLPHRLVAGKKDVRHTPTIIRPGLDIVVMYDWAKVDKDKLAALLEASFRRTLDRETYFARLQQKCEFVIVTGDYEGAAIVTREYAPGENENEVEAIAYLDKFAVLPSLQGSGAVDFLWGALRDEVSGLGLLDALNDNGGKGGFGRGRDLVWKSRSDNPVNRWYYERSNGFVRIDTDAYKREAVPSSSTEKKWEPKWSMFWCDAEERIASMAGERRLGAEASFEDVWDASRESSSTIASFKLTQDNASPFANEEDEDGRGRNFYNEHEYQNGAGGGGVNGDGSMTDYGRALRELDPRPGGGTSQKLLPVVHPDEEGRLDRWARCMATIPTAWA